MMLLTLLTVILGVGAQTDFTEPDKCCIGHQFTAILGEFGGLVRNRQGVAILGYQYLYYDYDQKMMALEAHMTNLDTHSVSVTTVLLDYNTNKEYTKLPTGACYYQDLPGPMQEPCIPANSKYMGSGLFGHGSSTLRTNAWEFISPDTNLRTQLTVTEKGCIPVFENSIGTYRGEAMNVAYAFTEFKPSIENRTLMAASTWTGCDTPLPPNSGLIGRRSPLSS